MDVRPGRLLCDRARAWAALLPDRELSELERKLLDRHLAGCAGCRAFAHDVAAVTELIRKEELVPLPQPVSVPSWRRHSAIPGRLGSLGAAAAVALMAVGIASRAPLPVTDDSNSSQQLPRVTDFGNNAPREVAQIQKLRQVYVTPDNVLRLRPAMQHRTLPA
jgi:predicted anti-sigma-YlaC factor YlaD